MVMPSVASICTSKCRVLSQTQSETWSLALQGVCGYAEGQYCSLILKYIISYFEITCFGDFRVPSKCK